MTTHKFLTKVEGGLGALKGVRLGALRAGIKASASDDKLDLAIIAFDTPQVVAQQITTNEIKAAPLLLSDAHIRQNSTAMRALVANSGCANACTGERGMQDATATAKAAATALGIDANAVIVASTGVIGVPLPMPKIEAGIRALVPALHYGADSAMFAARAIMTTDLVAKLSAYQFTYDNEVYTVGGIAKGSGMIAPSMATMLAFIATDFPLSADQARAALAAATADSFNMISVDGDMSTNDCVYLFAPPASTKTDIPEALLEALHHVCYDLAVAMVKDGEGATKVLTAQVNSAKSREQARSVARAIVDSNLVRTALHGGDPNWGRIIAAAGSVNAGIVDGKWSLAINGLPWVEVGSTEVLSEHDAHAAIAQQTVTVTLDLGLGSAAATAWGCDLSHAYVDINAHYRT